MGRPATCASSASCATRAGPPSAARPALLRAAPPTPPSPSSLSRESILHALELVRARRRLSTASSTSARPEISLKEAELVLRANADVCGSTPATLFQHILVADARTCVIQSVSTVRRGPVRTPRRAKCARAPPPRRKTSPQSLKNERAHGRNRARRSTPPTRRRVCGWV